MPLLFLLINDSFGKFLEVIGGFFLQEPLDDIPCLIRLAAMVEREDDELQACSITSQRLLYILEILTADRERIFWENDRLPCGIPFLRIEFILRADLTHHTLMNHLNEQRALFPRNRRGTELESCSSHRYMLYVINEGGDHLSRFSSTTCIPSLYNIYSFQPSLILRTGSAISLRP